MIVCCGEALIDFLPRLSKDGAPVYQPFCGGSVYNTAIALGRLGIPTGLFAGLSSDFFGDMLQDGLKASKVDLKYARVWDRPSTLAFVKLSDGHARYSFFDDYSAQRMLTRKDLPKLDKKVAALHFGSISLIPEPGGATLEAPPRVNGAATDDGGVTGSPPSAANAADGRAARPTAKSTNVCGSGTVEEG